MWIEGLVKHLADPQLQVAHRAELRACRAARRREEGGGGLVDLGGAPLALRAAQPVDDWPVQACASWGDPILFLLLLLQLYDLGDALAKSSVFLRKTNENQFQAKGIIDFPKENIAFSLKSNGFVKENQCFLLLGTDFH